MVAAIGSGVIPPQTRRLVSDCPRLPVRLLPEIGRTVVLSWPGVADASLTRPSPSRAVISMAGVETEITLCEGPMPVVKGRQRGLRWRMICPHCASVRDALHFVDGAWCCRGSACGNLSYACRHQMRYCPSVARGVRLRRALIRTRPGSLRARMLREQIRREGKAMVAHLERVNSALDKRSKRHARHGRRTSPERT
jgi:hypothetical protein